MSSPSRHRICVVSGGPSGEADASRASASAVFDALGDAGRKVCWVDLEGDGRWRCIATAGCALSPTVAEAADRGPVSAAEPPWQSAFTSLMTALRIDLVFPAIHGTIGEDGALQSLCESMGLPYVGSGPQASMLCYDKARLKRRVAEAGLPTAADICVARSTCRWPPHDLAAEVASMLGFPCIVKPSRSGSSLGLARVERPDQLPAALEQAFGFDDLVLVEELVSGIDVEIGVCEGQGALPAVGCPVGIRCEAPLYDFAAKYGSGDDLEMPAAIPRELGVALARAAGAAFECAGCSGFARVDFLVERDSGRFVVNELNTIPFITATSSFAESLKWTTGQTYDRLLTGMTDRAWAQWQAAVPSR